MDDNQYKVELGIKLNTSDLKTEIAQIDGKHKVKLGVDLGVKDIQDRIRQYNQNTNNIKVKLKATLDTDDLKKQIGKLNLGVGGKGLAVPVNTESLENSLREVSTIIKDIRNSLGTIDDKSDMKSLVVSVNQIATALEKATNESDGLAASLKALSQKDFNVNFGIKLGGDSFTNNALYGNEMRNNVIPKLKKQIDAMVREYNKQMGASADENEALLNLAIGTKFATPDFLQGFYTPSSNTLQGRMANDKNLKEQAHALREYINLFQQVAKLKGLNLDSVISDFSETPNELIKGAEKIKTGMSQTTDSIERLKSVFSTGLDVEGLSTVLQPLLEDIKAIRESIEGLSKGFSIDSITDSFREMSGILDTLTKNLNVFKDVLGSIGEGLGVSVEGDARQAAESANSVVQNEERKQQAIKQTQKLISDSAQQSIDKVSSQSINEFFKVDTTDSAKFKQEMENLVSQWTDAKGKLTDIKITTTTVFDEDTQQYIEQIRQAQVTYNNELGETIKKTIALRKIGDDDDGNPIMGFAETAGSYSKSLGQTTAQTNRFVKQQKNAVSDLTNTINQLNRAAIDQNAARPIKDTSHLDELKLKYNEVVSAIQRMENASDDNTFQEERNSVKKLITEYKSLRDEYKNAENTATSLRSKDISTAKSTYASELDVLISKMKSSGIYNAGFEKGAENLRSILSSATDTSGLNKFSNGLDKLEAGYKRAAAAVNEFNRSQKVGINTSGLQSKIADIQRISPEINQFEAEVDGAKVSVQSLLNDLSKVKTQGDFSVVNSRFKAFADAAKAAGIAVTETVSKIKSAKDIRIDIELGTYENQMSQMYDKFNKLSDVDGSLDNLRADIKQVEIAYNSMQTAVDDDSLVQSQKEYAAAIEKVNNQLKIQAREQAAVDRAEKLADDKASLKLDMLNWLKENTKATKAYKGQIDALLNSLDKLDEAGTRGARRKFRQIDKDAELKDLKGLTVFDQLKSKIKEYSVYFSAAELFMWAEQGLRSMFEQVKLIDSAMTELKKVTDETDASYEKFLTNAADRAREIGTTIDGLVSSTADFARLGYGFEDAQGLAEVANIYAVVGDEIEGVEGATESLISTMAAFKDEANNMSNTDFAMSIVDKFNEIGNNFAISSGGIGEALERSASSLDAANNTIDESIALITASNQVVQDPAVVGQALKTISMRIRGAKTE